LIVLSLLALVYGLAKTLMSPDQQWLGLATNVFWLTSGLIALGTIVRAAVWQPRE
jgi:hypothetical protein